MPVLSRWFIKSGMLYFLFALLLAAALAIPGGGQIRDLLALSRPVFYHALMVGWITQIIFGVSLWMFPRLSREKPRGSEAPGWVAFVALNTGLLLRVIAEPLQSARPDALWGWLLVVSALLQLLAGISYVMNIWKRIK